MKHPSQNPYTFVLDTKRNEGILIDISIEKTSQKPLEPVSALVVPFHLNRDDILEIYRNNLRGCGSKQLEFNVKKWLK